MNAVVPRFEGEWPFPGLKPAHYRALVVDPAWWFSGGTKGRPQHYKRMRDFEIAALPIHLLAHPEGCNVFVWSTSPMYERAPAVIRQWSRPGQRIRYSSRAFIWIKTLRRFAHLPPAMFIHPESLHSGHGYTTRKNAEDCLLYKFGLPERVSKKVREPIFAPLREHSRKPDESFERIELYCSGPYGEVFSRSDRKGWDAFGDEVGKFNPKPAQRAA